MNEDILSFIWRFQYFDTADLLTDESSSLSIIRTGYKNANAGPDFSEARVIIDGVQWIGSIEIHVRSSDWFLHTHDTNDAYEAVILHIVWENDRPVIRKDGTSIPTLSLKGLVKTSVLERYSQLQDEKEGIPCASMFNEVAEIQKYAMLDRVLLERLDRKASDVNKLLEINKNDWEETAYQWLAKHFGFKLNDHSFLKMAQIIGWKTLQKHRDRPLQIEALLFGCAGLLPHDTEEVYVRQLRNEFQFLGGKYRLLDKTMEAHEWKFSRLRPAGFPTVRIAQLARLLSEYGSLFSMIITVTDFHELQSRFQIGQSEYWMEHYIFGKKAKGKVPAMGADSSALLIINAIVPLVVSYAKQRQQPELLDKAIYWLSEIPAEKNRITRDWNGLGMRVKTSADSQALIEWFNQYCVPRKCLECTIGAALVRTV